MTVTQPRSTAAGAPTNAPPDHLYDIVQRRAASYPDLVALGGQEGLLWKTLTGRQLVDAVDTLAAELAARGVGHGDRVVLWVPNGWRAPVYFFAVWKLGAVVVPFDREMNPSAAEQIVESVEPRLLVVGYGERPAWAQRDETVEWWEPGRGASISQPDLPCHPERSEDLPDRPVGMGDPSLALRMTQRGWLAAPARPLMTLRCSPLRRGRPVARKGA